jgi:uncharacterized repeat protein (TIGR03803 family)
MKIAKLFCLTAAAALTMMTAPSQAVTYTPLHIFGASGDGKNPKAPLLRDSSGNLYGTTHFGGANSRGTIFKIDTSFNETILYDFCSGTSCSDGADPVAGLIMDTSGRLYGTTTAGGAHGQGVAFRFNPSNGNYTVMYDFCSSANCADGAQPNASLTYVGQASGSLYDGSSLLFGTTIDGGDPIPQNWGVAYVLKKSGSTWLEKVLHTFCPVTCLTNDGGEPLGITIDANNVIYGVSAGGAGPLGLVYKLTPTGNLFNDPWTLTHIYDFCTSMAPTCPDGHGPVTTPVIDASGNIYGATQYGGGGQGIDGDGVIYKLTPSGGGYTESVLHAFCLTSGCPDGQFSSTGGPLVIDGSGRLYGTTESGGANNAGVAFKYGPIVGYVDLYDFCGLALCADGKTPEGGLITDGTNFYGTTEFGGGSTNPGVAFTFN